MDKFLYCVMEFISSVFGMILLILSLISLRDYNFNSNMIELYRENWGKGPIKEIIVSPQSQGCPVSYEPFITDSFPGHFYGCDCFKSSSESFYQKVFTENCTSAQLKSKCSMITQSFNQTLSNWKGINICVKRFSGHFYLLKKHIAFGECPQGKESCGAYDSMGTLYCVDVGHQCPINYLEILHKDSITTQNIHQKHIKQIPLNNDNTLYYSHKPNADGKILINFRVNTHQMCYEPNEGMFGQNNFTFNRFQGYDFCVTSSPEGMLYDIRYTLVHTENQESFYLNNDINAKSLRLISTAMKTKSSSPVNLYSTNYFGWKKACYDQTKELFTLEKLIWPNTANSHSMIYLLGIISIIYCIFIIAMFALIMMLEDSKQKEYFWLIVVIFEICLLLSMLSLAITVIYNTMQLLEPFKMFKLLNCVEDITLHAFDLAYSKLLKVNQYLIPFATLTLFDVLCKSCILCLSFLK